MTDPIADFLTRIRNAVSVGHKVVEIPGSKIKLEMTKILKEKGYILNYKFEQEGARSNIKIALKYHPETKVPAIKSLVRVSKPGLRRYTNVEEMPRVLNGLGIAILSTSMGLMTDKEARQRNVGGEVLFISQFTLCADTSGGNRPSFIGAEVPEKAKAMYDYAAVKMNELVSTKKGVFGADMQIIQHNDGPITIELQKI